MKDFYYDIGDVVSIKGTTVKMTIENKFVNQEKNCYGCVWFDNDNRLNRANFFEEFIYLYK